VGVCFVHCIAFAFSPSGTHIAAIVNNDNRGQQYLQVWALENGRATKVYDQFHNKLTLSKGVALAFLSEFIVTVSYDEHSFGSRDTIKTIPLVLQLWSTADLHTSHSSPAAPPKSLQSLTLHVPHYRHRNATTSLASLSVECDLRLEPMNGRYLLLSSR
jgi:hypothetical protein